MIEIIILSIIQGITEFLPISSSAHLIIIENFFNFNNSNLNLDISLHIGSLFAVILFFIYKYYVNREKKVTFQDKLDKCYGDVCYRE